MKRSALTILAIVSVATLAACAPAPTPEPAETPSGEAKSQESSVARVPGYDVGQFPPVPLFTLPDLSVLDDARAEFITDFSSEIPDVPGFSVEPARCGPGGDVVMKDSLLLYGDGSGSYTGPDGSAVNYGDGSGAFENGDTRALINGDGSGIFDDGVTSILNNGDGSGSFVRDDLRVTVDGKGSGAHDDGEVRILNNGDGSGSYNDDEMSIVNNGDGTGMYSDDDISIINNGDGSGVVDGDTVEVAPLPPVAQLGVFPPIGVLAPIDPVCGTLITLPDSVLFDFDSSTLRPEGLEVVEALASALEGSPTMSARITGHTDAIGSDSYNQDLSDRRAASVVEALTSLGLGNPLESEGAGESRPVAPNELNGQDNPAGRQLNRRVEVFLQG